MCNSKSLKRDSMLLTDFVKRIAETIQNDWIGDKMDEIIKVVSDLL